jgi:uncharacterized membrane protein
VADRVDTSQRASVLGAFNACYGVAWFAGSALLGLLYDVDPRWLVAMSLALQWSACLVLLGLRTPDASTPATS